MNRPNVFKRKVEIEQNKREESKFDDGNVV